MNEIDLKAIIPANQRLAAEQMRAAQKTVDAVCGEIEDFQASLADNEETWMSAMGACGVMIRPATLTALGFDKIIVDGEDELGRRVRAIQHVSQVSLVLVAVKA